jgi:hypothetical protein
MKNAMQTHWGDLPVLDAHVHFFSHGFFRLLARQKEGLSVEQMGPLLGWRMPPEDPAALASEWAAELDRHGVQRAALIASLPGDKASVAAAVRAYPDRFYGYYFADPRDESAVLAAADSHALRVPCLFPAMHQYSLHDPRVTAYLEAVAGAAHPVVFVHCGALSVGVRKRLGLPCRFDMRFSNPIDLHGVALGFPHIRFVIPHFGAGYFREALMLADLCPNVYLDTSSSNSWMRYEGLSLVDVFRRALDVMGPQRLLFGSDSSFFPRGWNRTIFDAQQEALREIGVSADTARHIFGLNLEMLLR